MGGKKEFLLVGGLSSPRTGRAQFETPATGKNRVAAFSLKKKKKTQKERERGGEKKKEIKRRLEVTSHTLQRQ